MVDALFTTFCLGEVAICHNVTIQVLSRCHHDHRSQLLGSRNGLSECSTPKELGPVGTVQWSGHKEALNY